MDKLSRIIFKEKINKIYWVIIASVILIIGIVFYGIFIQIPTENKIFRPDGANVIYRSSNTNLIK